MHSFDHYYCNHSKWAINDLLIATQREHNDSKMIISSIGAVKVLVLIVHVNFNYPFKLGHKVGPAYYIPVCNILAILRYFYLQNCRNIGWYFSMPHTSHKKIKTTVCCSHALWVINGTMALALCRAVRRQQARNHQSVTNECGRILWQQCVVGGQSFTSH